MAKTEAAATAKKPAQTFTKQQIATSKRYATRRDLVNVLLEDGRAYTLNEVDEMIDKFMKAQCGSSMR